MPRLSLYRPNRSKDYQFLDRTISEMYTVGGLDLYVHKYLGPQIGDTGNADATIPVYDTQNPLFIEDLLLLENRDRAYDPDVFVMRGVYRTQDIDFDLTQFGLFLNNDTLFITFHYNKMIDTFGFSPTWLPHLWRVKATPMVNSQEFQQIINQPFMPENIWDPGNFYPAGDIVNEGNTYYQANQPVPPGTPITDTTYWTPITNPDTVGSQMSTRTRDLEINDAILTQAAVEVPLSGYDTVKFYILPTYANGAPAVNTLLASGSNLTGNGVPTAGETPRADGYTLGYLTGDGIAPNGLPVTPGVSFPPHPAVGDYALRLDYYPNRLFRYDGGRWVKIEDKVRTGLDLDQAAETQRAGFVNNTYTVSTTDMGNIPSRQSLSQILKPNADNGDQGGNLPPNPRPPGR